MKNLAVTLFALALAPAASAASPLVVHHPPADFAGTGRSALIWQNTNGAAALWLMNGTTQTSATQFGPYTGWSVLSGDADFNADGKSDLLWTHTNGAAAVWLMNGTTQVSAASFGPFPGWSVVSGNHDFNGDGKSDLLWKNTDGSVAIWLMDGTTVLSQASYGPYTGWSIVSGDNDFNGDGKSDLLWKNSNGAAALWLMDGTTQTSATQFGPYTGWSIVSGSSDFNGDGKSDLLWSNSNGAAALWLMNGLTQTSAAQFGPYTGWTVVPGRRDFNGDGKSDLLWSNSNGAAAVWLMNGLTQTSAASFGPFTGWSITGGMGDYNGDGMTDLLWSNSDGSAAVWLMNGTAQQSAASFGPYSGWSVTVLPAQPTIGSIDAVAEAEPYLSGNTVQYYCDCQAGAAAGCTPGSDTGGVGSQSSPFRTLDAAMTWVNGAAHRTAALCRGGSFTSGNSGNFIYRLSPHSCAAGSLCNEVREYPIGGAAAKPLITNPAGTHYLFATANGAGGWRFMNLKLKGSWDTVNNGNWGFFLYANLGLNPPDPIHDITIENVDMDSFNLAIDVAINQNDNIIITGNHIDNSAEFATLGACNHLTISYNAFRNNGSDNMFDHTIYVGSQNPVTDVAVVGNYIYGFNNASGNTTCLGGPLVGHGEFTNLTVSGNTVQEEATAGPGCWGISFNAGGYPTPTFFRNAIFTDNIVINGGNMPMSVNNAPNALIANNLIIQQSANNGGAGIAVPNYQARSAGTGGLGNVAFTGAISGTALTVNAVTSGALKAGMTLSGSGIAAATTIVSGSGNSWVVSSPQTVAQTAIIGQSCVPGSPTECSDTQETGATVVNNTIYSDVASTNGMGGGIQVAIEGSGYTVANNTVVYTATGHQLQTVSCFNYSLTPVADHFSFIDYNNCHSNDSIAKWERTSGTLLANWQQGGFDAHSTYAPPGWSFATPLTLPTWDDNKTAAQLYAPFFRPAGAPLAAAGNHAHAPSTDITGATRPAAPSIGAYEP